MKTKLFVIVTMLLVCLTFLSIPAHSVNTQQDVLADRFESPLPTPTPAPLSFEAQVAIEFVARQQNIAIEKLQFDGEQSIAFPMIGREYVYVSMHHNNANQFQIFSVLVDPKTKEVETDYNAVRDTENAAYRSKYGKFEPALFERLQTIADEEMVTVTIWASHINEKLSEKQLVDQVITRYPNSEKAFNDKGTLWQVDDERQAGEIQAYYEQLLQENATARTQSLGELLKEQNFTIKEFAILPAISATLPKHLIVEIEKRKDVSEIFLTEGESRPELDIAMPTDRLPTVWARGYKGSSIRIAILEMYNINATADSCLDIYRVYPSTTDPTGHKSSVASAAACNDGTKRGAAYEAQIADAGYTGGEANAINALDWATAPTPTSVAHVVNRSESDGGIEDTLLHLSDKAYDYYVRQRHFTIVNPNVKTTKRQK